MPRPVLNITEPYTPEMLKEAYRAIEDGLPLEADVFEFGGGYSTVWLAQQVKRVVWVEHDAAWYEETERALRAVQKISRSKGILVNDENDIAGCIDNYGEFDLILVDCLDRQRVAAVKAAIPHLASGGIFVLDDSQWPMLAEAKQLLEATGWPKFIFNGDHKRKGGMVRRHETTLYVRPYEDEEE